MQQYFVGKTEMQVSDLVAGSNNTFKDKIFANERVDSDWNKSQLNISNSTFAKMGLRESKFTQCDLSFCVFIDCYFKKAFFDQTKFVSCIFINCNFDMATFLDCDFRYATFNGCFIPYGQMRSNLPHSQENLCADICRNLSMQCLDHGAIDDYKAYLFEEKAAGEIHAIRKLFHRKNSYYSKYNLLEGIEGLFVFLRSKISKYLWGYGEKMGVLLRNIVVIIVAYGLLYLQKTKNIIEGGTVLSKFLSSLYLSASTFFSAGNQDVPVLQTLQLSEHVIGLVLMGFFGAALFHQINRK